MNRLQKKCVIVAAGVHLLLLVALFCSGFFKPKPKLDDSQLLDVIPANLIDAAFSSGVANAAPLPPEPVTPPQPPAPVPVVVPPPVPVPVPDKVEPVKPIRDAVKPEQKPPEHKIDVSLKPVIHNASKSPPKTSPDAAARARAIRNAVRSLQKNFTPGTVVDMPGTGSVAYASYKDALATLYYNAWITPSGTANNEANTTVRITVASDGTVINAQIITPSGDEQTDASVRRALERVPSVPALPDKEKAQQDFTIIFNLKTKQMLE